MGRTSLEKSTGSSRWILAIGMGVWQNALDAIGKIATAKANSTM
jgi:hypothetical protein